MVHVFYLSPNILQQYIGSFCLTMTISQIRFCKKKKKKNPNLLFLVKIIIYEEPSRKRKIEREGFSFSSEK